MFEWHDRQAAQLLMLLFLLTSMGSHITCIHFGQYQSFTNWLVTKVTCGGASTCFPTSDAQSACWILYSKTLVDLACSVPGFPKRQFRGAVLKYPWIFHLLSLSLLSHSLSFSLPISVAKLHEYLKKAKSLLSLTRLLMHRAHHLGKREVAKWGKATSERCSRSLLIIAMALHHCTNCVWMKQISLFIQWWGTSVSCCFRTAYSRCCCCSSSKRSKLWLTKTVTNKERWRSLFSFVFDLLRICG